MKFTKTTSIVVFTIILVISIFLRFYKLGVIPDGLQQDETSLGYNAYSILLTGKDEHGVSLPQNFKAFGEYKLPGYIYASVIPIRLFGFTPFSVRFISALSGVITVICIFFISKLLLEIGHLTFPNQSKQNHYLIKLFPYLSMLLLTINPWHLHFSRAAYEVMLASCLISVGFLFFLLFIKNKSTKYLYITVIAFVASIYTYNIARAFTPLFSIALIYLFNKSIPKISVNKYIPLIILTILLAVPFIIGFFSIGGENSTRGTIIFTSAVIQSSLIEFRSYFAGWPIWITKILLNSFILTFWQYVNNFISYFSTSFYFVNAGINGNNSIGTSGYWYQFEIIFILTAIFIWIKYNVYNNIFPICIFLVIAVASLTREAPQATRSFLLVVPVTVCSAYGLLVLINKFLLIKFYLYRYLLSLLSISIVFFYVFLYLSSYYVRFPIYYAKHWRTADREVSLYIKSNNDKYENIIFDSDSGFMYTSLLFYLKYYPGDFQKEAEWTTDDSEGFSKPIKFGKFSFKKIDWINDLKKPNTLLVTKNLLPDNISSNITIFYPKRPVAFAVGQNILRYPVEEIAYIMVSTIGKSN